MARFNGVRRAPLLLPPPRLAKHAKSGTATPTAGLARLHRSVTRNPL